MATPIRKSDFSPWETLYIPQPEPVDTADCPDCTCDDDIPEVELTNFELRTDLQKGDTIVNKAGTSRFIIESLEKQSDDTYKGVFLFWVEIWKLKVICNYWDLQVNTDNVIVNMDYESVYDPQFLVDVDAAADYLNELAENIGILTASDDIKDTIPVENEIINAYVTAGDSVVVVTVDEKSGDTINVVVSTDPDDIEKQLIKGAGGEEYIVNKDGELMGKEEYLNTGGGNSTLKEEYFENKEENELSEAVQVDFSASSKQKYGFDLYNNEKTLLKDAYPQLNNGYNPPYKSIASFGTDWVGVSEQASNIVFKNRMGITAIKAGNDISIRGAAAGTDQVLYAYQQLEDSTQKIAGKLNIRSYDEQIKKLYIVAVNDAELPNETELQKTLNIIYKQAVTQWQVIKIDTALKVTFANGQMTHGGSSAVTVYNTDQRAIINAFKEKYTQPESDAFYLFFVKNVQGKTGDIGGYMPLQRQVGFIYENPKPYIIAHELGHGAFNLWHTFSSQKMIAPQGQTQNLMDYNKGGTELWQHQWDLIHDPQNILFAFMQDESEGEALNTPGLQELIDRIKKANLNKENFIPFHDYKTTNDNKSIVYLQKTVKLLEDEIPLGVALHVFSKEELNKLASNSHEKIDYRTPGVVGKVPGGFTYRMDFEYLNVNAVLNEGNYEKPKIALEFFLKKENYEIFHKYLSGESTLASYKDYIVCKADANIRKKESPYALVSPAEFIEKGKEVVLISHLTTGSSARALVRYKDGEEEYCTSTSNLKQIVPIEDEQQYKLREELIPLTLPFSEDTEKKVKTSEILYVTHDCGEYKCINKKDDDEFEFLGWVKADKLKKYIDNSKLGKDEFSQKYLKATETAVDDIIEDWETNEAACNLCVRAALYNLTGDEVLYPKTGSSTTIRDEGEQLHGEVVTGEGNAQGIIDDLNSGILKEYFEEITINNGESYPDFWKRVQNMVDNKEIVIGTYDPGHIFMVVPGGLYEVVDNSDHLVWNKTKKRMVLKDQYKTNPVIEEGDKYGYTFAKNGFDYVLRIMDCGKGAKISNGPAYALMDRAAMKCEPNKPVVRLYKYIKK